MAENRTSSILAAYEEMLRHRAYKIYEGRGGEPGHDQDDWLQAERELRTKRGDV